MAPPPTLSTVTINQIAENATLFTYNQPKISNAFTLQQYYDLRDALLWALAEPKINVIVQ
jgi:peroxisomal 3,2-trans-enoyl-CoA isomerase